MEENKYYTPELKEFHVGFEYEYLNSLGRDFGKWTTEAVYVDASLYHISSLLASCAVRVKYLDKDDIEELGFKYDSDSGTFKLWSNYEMYEIKVSQGVINIERFYQTKLVAKILPFSEWKSFNIFNGIIKNKSELKDILEKLGIEF